MAGAERERARVSSAEGGAGRTTNGRIALLRRRSSAAIRWSGLWLPVCLNGAFLASLLVVKDGVRSSDIPESLRMVVGVVAVLLVGPTPLYALFGVVLRSLHEKYPRRWPIFDALLIGLVAIPLSMVIGGVIASDGE